MTEQQTNGQAPDANQTPEQPPARRSLDDLIGPLDEASRKALRDYIAGLNDQAARYRTKVRELEPKAAQHDQAQEAAKSEQQKAAEALSRIERERDDAKASLLRYDVAASFPGLQASDAAFLTGSSREELEASAHRLLARIQAAGQRPAPMPPAPDRGQGREGANGNMDPESWIRGALRHR